MHIICLSNIYSIQRPVIFKDSIHKHVADIYFAYDMQMNLALTKTILYYFP